jgi:hypothetical protein
MIKKLKNLKDISDAELHKWIAVHNHDPDAADYIAGIEELMRRNAAPARRRELIALAIASVSIIVTIVVIVVTNQ